MTYSVVINSGFNLQSIYKTNIGLLDVWKPLDLDTIESTLNQTTDPRSEDLLFDEVKIVCIVADDTFNKLGEEEVEKTWGQRCNKLVFANIENGILLLHP